MLFNFADIDTNQRHRLLISTIVPRPIACVSILSATCDSRGSYTYEVRSRGCLLAAAGLKKRVWQ